jgi:hypothetical protein
MLRKMFQQRPIQWTTFTLLITRVLLICGSAYTPSVLLICSVAFYSFFTTFLELSPIAFYILDPFYFGPIGPCYVYSSWKKKI